jgi:hypothetical protein
MSEEQTTSEAIAIAKRDRVWNIWAWIFVYSLLIVGTFMMLFFIPRPVQAEDALKIIAAILGISAFVASAFFQKISSEMVANILGTIIGFALGISSHHIGL